MSNTNKKIAVVLDHPLMHYRIPLFRRLAGKGYRLSVFYPVSPSEEPSNSHRIPATAANGDLPFSCCKTDVKSVFGLYYYGLKRLNNFDVVIWMQNLRILDLWLATLTPGRSGGLIHWGIGTSSSKGLKLEKTILSRIRDIFTRPADALILYSAPPARLFGKQNQKKIFTAHNTVENSFSRDYSSHPKKSFVFIGSFTERKGLGLLLDMFSKYLKQKKHNGPERLVLIGSGKIETKLRTRVEELGLENHVVFAGKITDMRSKKRYFKEAVAMISPLQAGLSVLESFSFGVPVITFRDAIHGGELFNIRHGVNGLFVRSQKELLECMLLASREKQKMAEMGRRAYEHYRDNRTMEQMADTFISAIEYATQKM